MARAQTTDTARRRAMIAVAGAFALLLGAMLFATLLGLESNRAATRLATAGDIRYDIARVLELIDDGETGQQGFLLTGDPRYLQPYESAGAGYAEALDVVARHVPSYGLLASQVGQLRVLADRRFAELARSVDLVRQGQREQAITLVNTDPGRSLTLEIRQVAARMTTDADDARTAAAGWRSHVATALAATIAVLLTGAIVVAALLLRGTLTQFRLLAQREASLHGLTATLETRIAHRTRALAEVNQRFAAALRAANITVFTQNESLAYNWINRDALGLPPDHGGLPATVSSAMTRLKEDAVATGEATRTEVRVARDGADRWFEMSAAVMAAQDGGQDGIVGSLVDITHRKDQEARIRLLLREVTHRSKNLLAVIQAIMRQTATSSAGTADFVRNFSARLQALAGSHDLLVREDWGHIALSDLIRSQLGHYSDLVGSQIMLAGGEVHVRPDAAQHIGMALHELATNAAKYGALSTPAGRVQISWTLEAGTPEADRSTRWMCRLAWVESNGPTVVPPVSRGFGRVVIERTVARAVDGEVSIVYAPEGVRWTLVFPPDNLEGHAD